MVFAKSSRPLPDLRQTGGAVLLAERLPGEAYRKFRVVLEEPPAHDGVVGALELEQQWLTSFEHAEPATPFPRGPEVDLLHASVAREDPQVFEPSLVGDRDVCLHGRLPGGEATKMVGVMCFRNLHELGQNRGGDGWAWFGVPRARLLTTGSSWASSGQCATGSPAAAR